MRDVIQGFLLEFPDVNVEVYSRNSRELAKVIESGELDVLVAIDETLEDTDILIKRPLRRDTAHRIARHGDLLTQVERGAFADIIKHRVATAFLTDKPTLCLQAHQTYKTGQANNQIQHHNNMFV